MKAKALSPRAWTWLSAALFFVFSLPMHAADLMLNPSKFYMSNNQDHVTFNVLLCDLDYLNTYAKSDGCIYAISSSGQRKDLIHIWYIEEGSDDNPFGKVRARCADSSIQAWFTNSYIIGEQQLSTSEQDYMITKWGGSNHYCTPSIEFYFPSDMAGKEWEFMYQFKHSSHKYFTYMKLGKTSLSKSPAYLHLKTSDYKAERTGPDKIKFTVPKLPDDVSQKLSGTHIHEGFYKVTFTYKKQDNTTEIQTDSFLCDKTQRKEYTVTIPQSVGNPKQVDMKVVATDRLKDAVGGNYWKETYTYNTHSVFEVVPVPAALRMDYRQFDKMVDLSWDVSSAPGNYMPCFPYIYRMETDKNGKPTGSGTWSRRGKISNPGTNMSLSYSDNSVQQESYYKYMVLNVPMDWENKGISSALLSNPDEALLKQLGYVESDVMHTKPTMTIYGFEQDTTVRRQVKLQWLYSRVPSTSATVKFQVMRRKTDSSAWSEIGNVTGDANPDGSTPLTFTDSDIPNDKVRYQYLIRLSLNEGRSLFESEMLTAGMLEGSSIKSFTATKGTHEGTVRLSWEALQAGTDNTTYVISRRYVDSQDDFIPINTTSGTATLYTYEDNTVQPGYYYEYKIEVYSDNRIQNTLRDVGFCQARGVITGRITFGSGESVEDVRLTLHPSASDDHAIKGASKRIGGASTGLVWNADAEETDKLFGSDKSFSVQFFVRPDEDLSEGAVIGEIPSVGKLAIGGRSDTGYKLLLITEASRDTVYTTARYIRGIVGSPDVTTTTYHEPWQCDVYPKKMAEDIVQQWRNEGYYVLNYSGDYTITPKRDAWNLCKDVPLSKTIKYGRTTRRTYDTELSIPANSFSLLTVSKSGSDLSIAVGEQVSQELTFISETISTDENLNINTDPELSDLNLKIYDHLLYTYSGDLANLSRIDRGEEYGMYLVRRSIDECGNNYTISDGESTRRPFTIGGATGITEEQAFKGNVTEVRVFDHLLTQSEQAAYADRIMNGREKGLRLYWPMDEGLTRYVFDASYSNDMPNGHHGTVGQNISVSNITPTEEQLSRYAVTDANGEYIIRGIPFVGSGSTYTVIPSRGIHEFSPNSRNGFIGSSNLTLNSFDFSDISSFPVKGKITYLNTNIPADSIQFRIDGKPVQTKEGLVMTDANGEYTLSVPIGPHLIEAYKEGHRLSSFPLDGTTYDFKQSETVNFTDSTLVNVTGRINGGYSDQNAPIGFAMSKNRIGKATVKLSLGRDTQCSFNYVRDANGYEDYGKDSIIVASASTAIKSTAYRAGGGQDETKYIYITTDPETGEFSAMLPPLRYMVESIKFEGGEDYDRLPVFAQNLPVIDATNAISEKQPCDSLRSDDAVYKYRYAAKMVRQYRATPDITVVQQGTKNGAFGEVKVPVTTLTNTTDTLQVLTYTDDGYSYAYDHPFFCQGKRYGFEIKVAEKYKNLDTGETFDEKPRDAVISIINDASILTQVYAEKVIINGEEAEAGTEYRTPNIDILPDSTGTVFYEFEGGWPNLSEGHIRNMSIGVRVDGRTTMWQAPDSKSEALDLILLGSLPTGTNFMTQGPDKVDYVIRRPPGSNSVASLEKTKIDNFSKSTCTVDDSNFGGGAYISLTPTWEVSEGMIIMNHSKFQFVNNTTNTRINGHKDSDYSLESKSYTTSEKISTPSQMIFSQVLGDYRPENGDTYLGRSTNLTFSKARLLGFYQQADGTYQLAQKDGIAMSESFETQFSYTQAYIIDNLIPNWKAFIKDRLVHVDGNHWEEANSPKIPGKVTYYTSYNEGDPEWGRANGDRDFWGSKYDERHGNPGYIMRNGTGKAVTDSVEFAINQIRTWEAKIAQNEADKYNAFEDASNLIANYSISGGMSISHTDKTETKTAHQVKDETYWCINNDVKFGFLLNNAGTYAIMTWKNSKSTTEQTDTTTTETTSIAWTLSDSDTRTALSVDVYNSPNKWGPIFRTRGGQTVNPYEKETQTIYYAKGTKLNEGTMRVEMPELNVMGASEQTDIPVGGAAKFTLQLHNASEINAMCTYILEALDNSNPNGAILMVDGSPLSNGREGRSIKMKGDETVLMQLLVSQSDRSIVDYEDIKIVLRSEKDPSTVSKVVTLRVHFVPASAHVDLAVDHTVLNSAFMAENNGILANIHNLDRQDKGLRGLRLRFRRKGTDTWNLVKQWSVNAEDWTLGYSPMPDGSAFTQPVSFLEDGIYELQAQTFGKYGNEDVTYESEIIDITQDTRGPKVMGMPSPENGLLTYTFRNNMHVRFNEDLNDNALSKSDNFAIYGDLNNVALNSQYPDVALQLNGEKAATEAKFSMSNTDFAIGCWFYRKGDGNIFSIGTEDNMLALYTHDGGKLAVRIGSAEQTYDFETALPEEKWTYLAMSYWTKDEVNTENRISLLYVNSDMISPIHVGKDVSVGDFDATGQLNIGGSGTVGMMRDLTLWNVRKTTDELYETRSHLKAANTPGLIGYWRMNEGHGTVLADKARSRNIVASAESWYINNRNLAAHLDGTQFMNVDISTFNPRQTDNFALEMWFRAEDTAKNDNASLLYIRDNIAIGFRSGLLTLELTKETPQAGGTTLVSQDRITLSETDYIDNAWHHITLNVRRGNSAIFYIDGKAVKTLPESSIPGISGDKLYVGCTSSVIPQKFVGDIDELRIWNAALSSSVIDSRRYERLDASSSGLVGYFPMESIHRTQTGNVVTEFSTANMGQDKSTLAFNGSPTEALTAPALLPGSQHMRMDDSQFNFTASKNEVYFSFPDDVLPLMDGNDFSVSVRNIKDEHANSSEPVEWMFHADFACVAWEVKEVQSIRKHWSESSEIELNLLNTTGQTQTYEITGQPSWMEVSEPIGTMDETKAITIRLLPTAAVGKHTAYLYVTDRYSMKRVVKLNIVVTGDEPKWSVDPNLYESNMTLTGQLYVGDKISEFTDSKIAAFDSYGNCRGVASPKYVGSRDAYYVDMIIYGGEATEISSSQRDLTFRLYDASTGITYPVVNITTPDDGKTATVLRYAPDATIGSYARPVVLRSTQDLMQSVTLARGWNWTSMYLKPADTDINNVLPKGSATIAKFKNIKSQTAFAVANADRTGFIGELGNIEPGQMYKIQVSSSTPFDVLGAPIDLMLSPQTIYPLYNWIGPLSGNVMSVADAFADLEPEKDDMVKTRTAMATYNGQGVWEGTLQSIVPGEGYIYFSNATQAKTFHYPSKHTSFEKPNKAPQRAAALTHFQPVDSHIYPDNMNIIAVVTKDGERVTDAEVAAFVGDECRGAVTARGNYYFLTIMGDSQGDLTKPVELRVFDGTEEHTVGKVSFVSDAFLGTLDEPYNLDMDATGVENIWTNDNDAEWFTVSGIKLPAKPTKPGMYIVGGRKVIVSGTYY